jgi:hypothetical protein
MIREEGKDSSQEARPAIVRKPYAKPAFRCERVFETMALSCGKARPRRGSVIL